MASTSSRMLRLLSLLQTHRYWAGAELASRLEVSPRTLRRDVERLRELGYPVDAVRGVAGGYQLQAGAALPPLLLDDDEAVAIAVGLRAAAGGGVAGLEESAVQALTKILAVMPPRLRRRMEAVRESTMPSPVRGPVLDATALTTLAQACRDGERVRFGYADRSGAASRRHVEPHRLVTVQRRWYLVAWDLDREDWRTFRLDRVRDPESTRFPAKPRELPAEDAVAFVERGLARMPRKYDVRVLVHADATTVARQVLQWGRVDPVTADSCRVTMPADWLDGPLMLLVEIGADFEVESPPELAERVREVSSRFARAAT
ncbi:YafY family protein [Nocardioides sp.]|uniref:helix-turn-helix transcriptional regulator n=1 Tax=Nocardioides sp. TaxID=35761 RepID=UPI002733E088|nr:YafY family protein [Nocardioides sp.]MDP3890005.1 YafY family protein [Nocardioides sp.]